VYADELAKQEGGLFRLKVILNEAFSDPADKAVADEYVNPVSLEPYHVVLRELKSQEMVQYVGLADAKRLAWLEEKLGGCIIDHNLIGHDEKKVPEAAVANIIRQSSTILFHVLEVWQKALPLAKRMQKASAGSAPSSSPGAVPLPPAGEPTLGNTASEPDSISRS